MGKMSFWDSETGRSVKYVIECIAIILLIVFILYAIIQCSQATGGGEYWHP